MKATISIFGLLVLGLFFHANAFAAEKMFRCDGVYQNKPCSAYSKETMLDKLPIIGRVSTNSAVRSSDDSPQLANTTGARARLRMPTVVKKKRAKSRVIKVDGAISDKTRAAALVEKAHAIRREVRNLADSREFSQTEARVHRLFIEIDKLCSKREVSESSQVRSKCDRARRDLKAAHRYLRNYD